MVEKTTQQRSWWRPLAVLAIALAAALATTGVSASSGPLPVHGAVFQWADDHPGEPVPLIVQHDGTPDELVEFVTESGGAVEREFHIVPALDVEIDADAVDDLARLDDVNWVSLDAPVYSTGTFTDTGALSTAYPYAINAPQAWQSATGEGVTIAVVDTGVSSDAQSDFVDASGALRIQWHTTNSAWDPQGDGVGHGTHVAGIAAGASTKPQVAGKYVGIAPHAKVLALRIADDAGNATVGDLMGALQFVDDNKAVYNIRVVNLSINSSVAQSYTVDPLDAAVEMLWFHGIVVVVAAGNAGSAADAVHYPPANDPFVITVGAFDDMGTNDGGDDRLASWSSRGLTQDGFAKPDVLAPGANIVAPVSATSYVATNYPAYIVERAGTEAYFRMSGTSMATPVVVGLAALVLEDHPGWTPGELKYVLMQTGRPVSGQGEGVLADAAVTYTGELKTSDDGLKPSYILLNALGVSEVDFDGIRWRNAVFNGIRWAGLELNGIRWSQVDWSGIRWSGVEFNGIRWGGLDFQGIRWSAFIRSSECDDDADVCSLAVGIGNAPEQADPGREQADERAFDGGESGSKN